LIHAVILAGGRGERFWPLSRSNRPKQLLRLISDKTMLQETVNRILPIIPSERLLIVTSDNMVEPILSEIKELTFENILSEPFGRNTCLAIGLAARHIQKTDPEGVMVVLSADHIIRPAEKLHDLILAGAEIAASDDKLITIGIDPTRPETGYGYIKLADQYRSVGNIAVYMVEAFTEKPGQAVAQEYYYGRRHLWNSGMFIWSVRSILDAIGQCVPDIGAGLDKYASYIGTAEELTARRELYDDSDSISIDFAVLENAANVLAIKGDIIWDDIGSWNSLERYKERDHEHNVIVGNALTKNAYENTIYNEDEGLIVALGISDLVVVKTDNVVLVAHKAHANEVKEVLADIARDENSRKYL
jgi:mannose-1-phosphate guanylyltransferase